MESVDGLESASHELNSMFSRNHSSIESPNQNLGESPELRSVRLVQTLGLEAPIHYSRAYHLPPLAVTHRVVAISQPVLADIEHETEETRTRRWIRFRRILNRLNPFSQQ